MKTHFNKSFCALALIVSAACTTDVSAQDVVHTAEQTALLRQVAAVLDYVGADYAKSVAPDGRVLEEGELREQADLAGDALTLARRASLPANDAALTGLQTLAARIAAHAPPVEIEELCRTVRRTLVETHRLVLSPASTPDFQRGALLYREAGCNTCHGDRGDANTDAAQRLTPRPANFLDEERAGGISPVRAYSAITFGIARTAMVRFDTMPSADRWNLAFYVLTLRHSEADARAGAAIAEHFGGRIVPSGPVALADLTANSLRERYFADLSAEESRKVIAYLQRTTPFVASTETGFGLARRLLGNGLEAYRAGERDEAQRLFVSAYLDGVEPREAGLRARNSRLALAIENAMMAIREGARQDLGQDAQAARVRNALALFDAAERGHADASSSFIGSMAIALREGFEAALLIAALLGLVRKRGVPEHAKYIHIGWLLALPAGLLTWLLVGTALSGMQRELSEGIISLVAAFVLLGVTHWIVGQVSSREFMGFLSKRVGSGLAFGGRQAAFAALGLAFLAAYREVFELVLFYQALLLDAGEHARMVWLGACAGVAILIAIVFALRQIGQKIPPRPFMLGSSVLLAVLALMLVGKGVRALQEAVVIPMTALQLPELPTIGFFATREGLIAQATLALLLVTSALWPWLAARKARKEATTPPRQPTP
ncbi:MAG: FTR1 family protein [Sandaracinaceae bacterium]|nr:FTR1 family protein [Sandaracinaceae bacterium]